MKDKWQSIPNDFSLEDLDKLQIINEEDPQKIVAVRIGLMCSFYMRDPHSPEVRLALAQCGDHYQRLAAEHLKSYIKPDGCGSSRLYPEQGVNLVEYIQQKDDIETKDFAPCFFGDKDPYVAASYGLDIFASSQEDSPVKDEPAYFSAILPLGWLKNKEGEGAFQKLIVDWCKILKPFHAYAGIGAIQSMHEVEKKRTNHLVYPLARRFPGLEVDKPGTVASKMTMGGEQLKIKGVNWLTALDDQCFEELGGRDAVLGDLGEAFTFYEYDGGVLIQAGIMPQLGDVNQQHIPRYYQQLARKLKPVRMSFPEGHFLIKSPDRNQQSNAEASNEWLARLD